MKTTIAVTFALIVLSALPALAGERYFTIAGGAWLPARTSALDNDFNPTKTDYKTGWSAGGAIGVATNSGIRLENELIYRQAQAKGSSEDQWSLGWLVNIWYDLRNSSPLTPYFGGGFGYARGAIASPGPISGEGNGIAYQAGGGLDIRLDRGLSLDIGYRYFGVSNSAVNDGLGFELAGSTIQGGLRFRY